MSSRSSSFSKSAGKSKPEDTVSEDVDRHPDAPMEDPNNFICLSGAFTGDIWHCAAARILWEQLDKTGVTGLESINPVICISIYNYVEGHPNFCVENGQKSYAYFTGIGLSCVLVAVPEAGGGVENSNNALTFKQVGGNGRIRSRGCRRRSRIHSVHSIPS